MDDARDADVDVDAAIARCGSFDVSGAATGGGTRAVVDDDDDDDEWCAVDDGGRDVSGAAAVTRDLETMATASDAPGRARACAEALGRCAGRLARDGAEARTRAGDRARASGVIRAYARAVCAWTGRGEAWRASEAAAACGVLTRAAAGRARERSVGGEAEDDGTSYKPPHAREGDRSDHKNELEDEDARVAALGAIAALARSDGKATRGAWAMLLPTSQHQLERTSAWTSVVKISSCDCNAKVRAAAANATAALFEGAASKQYVAMAECEEPNASAGASPLSARVRSFSALSTTLGSMVVTTQRALLRALSSEEDATCVREQCKAVSALCSAAPFDRLPRALLTETINVIHERIKKSVKETPSERALAQGALFGALISALSARGASGVMDELLTEDETSVIATIISHAKGDAVGSRCEAFGVLRAFVVHHVVAMTKMRGRLRYLFPDEVCASEADDRVCQASARLFTDFLGAVSGSGVVRDDDDSDVDNVPFNPSSLSIEDLCATWEDAVKVQLPACAAHKYALTRVAGLTALTRVNANVVDCFESDDGVLDSLLKLPHAVLKSGEEAVPAVRAAACRALGFIINLPNAELEHVASSLLIAAQDNSKSVKIPAIWSIANLCSVNASRPQRLNDETVTALARVLIISAMEQGDKVRANATRGIGHLISATVFDASNDWLHEAAQSLASCLTTGNAKTQWNACHGVGSLLQNDSAMKVGSHWIDFIVRMLLLLIRDARNFKIRLHAAMALAAGAKKGHLMSACSDTVSVLTSSLEALEKQNAAFESQSAMDFKHKSALICQLTTTLVSVLAVDRDASVSEALKKTHVLLHAFEILRDFLVNGSRSRMDPRIVAGFNAVAPRASEMSEMFSTSLKNILDKLRTQRNGVSAFEKLIL